MATMNDYEIPKDQRPEGSRNFPLVFPTRREMHQHAKKHGLEFKSSVYQPPNDYYPKLRIALYEGAGYELPADLQGYSDHEHTNPSAQTSNPFFGPSTTLQCPEPESDGQESASPSVPRVLLPPSQERLRYGINEQGRFASQFDPFTHPLDRGMSKDFSLSPPYIPQSQDNGAQSGFENPSQSPERDNSHKGEFVPSRRQVVTHPNETIVDSPTFNALYAPIQSRRDLNSQSYYPQLHQKQHHMSASPFDSPMGAGTPMSHRSHKRSQSAHRRELQAIRDEQAKGFDSEDDDIFFPNAN
ncbi:hypothetical protein F4804DRAFT_300942 [Jackrogersella minutella]|nr:hypothetical protein F4804DRAFT_300942 [Jackrogersella minutella]